MARATKHIIWIFLAFVAAPGFVASPAAAAERVAMVGLSAAYPGSVRKASPQRGPDAPALPARSPNGTPMRGGYQTPHGAPITYRPPRLAKSLRIDLSRLQVTRPAADERPAQQTGWVIPRIIHIGVKKGLAPGAKTVGVEMPVAPHLALESRIGPDGEGDMALRFLLRY